MQKIITTILAIVLILSSFGVVSFAFMDHGIQHGCPVAIMHGSSDCVNMANGVNLALHHISGFQDFTQTIVSSKANLAILLLFVVSLLFLSTVMIPGVDKSLYRQIYHHQKRTHPPVISRILRWLALRNKRNTYPKLLMSGYLA